ncbi:MAG: NAD(P)-binding protein, partial [Gemmatimonadota bacterium]|nr:NAD(P)-binding protein [Gemmatimonadota bacterium]
MVGSGAAGGVMARELARPGFSVVVLEQGPRLESWDFRHDEWGYKNNEELDWGRRQGHPQTYRRSEEETAEISDSAV